jgi:malonate-semialdehyde dehydrogenase (acetylating)/methylmalonate-semialdehyde dehydrogenase
MNAAVTTELKLIGHWIGGESIRGASGRKGPVYNPATGEQTGEVDFASPEEIDTAVATAKEAFATWRTTSLSKRADLFFRIYQLFDEYRDDLARLLTAEHGKVLSDARGEVQRGLEQDQLPIPADIDYQAVRGLSIEVRQKLDSQRPETLGHAARISGVTPAAISLLLVHLKRGVAVKPSAAARSA